MSDHAKLAPSAAHRWMACPGSVSLSAGIPNESSVYADEGTFAHLVASWCLQQGRNAESFVGVSSDDRRFTVDADMARHINTYLRVVRGILEFEDGLLKVESRVHVDGVDSDVWGTADALILNGSDLHVIDFKYGAGVFVPAEMNEQLMIYGLGALHHFDLLHVTTVYLHVVQPRCPADRVWRTAEVSAEILRTWFEVVLRPAIAAASSDSGKLSPGDNCRFCPAKPVCPALRDHALQHVQHVFAVPSATPPAPTTLSMAEISNALRAFPLVEEWMAAVRKHAYDRVMKFGDTVPGFKLVRKFGHRKWADEPSAAAKLRQLGIDPFTAPKLVTPAEAERRLGDKKKLVSEMTVVPDIGTSLEPESDPRPAWLPGSVFTTMDKES